MAILRFPKKGRHRRASFFHICYSYWMNESASPNSRMLFVFWLCDSHLVTPLMICRIFNNKRSKIAHHHDFRTFCVLQLIFELTNQVFSTDTLKHLPLGALRSHPLDLVTFRSPKPRCLSTPPQRRNARNRSPEERRMRRSASVAGGRESEIKRSRDDLGWQRRRDLAAPR